MNPSDLRPAACPHDCPDSCALRVTVRDGRVHAVSGDPEHPLTQGFLCAKVAHYERWVHHPDRLLTPLRRVGAKGDGRFEPCSWDRALGEIAHRWGGLLASEEGPPTILPYSYGGTIGVVQGASMDRRLFGALGASRLDRTICASAGGAGYESTLGASIGTDPEEVEGAKLILLWGSNTLTSNCHLWPALRRARARGARLVAIDVYRTRTAARCDETLLVRPGTDAALALAMMHVILRDGLEDRDYCERYTVGLEALRERVAAWTPARAAAACGVEAGRIEALAREYATRAPAFIRTSYGLQRTGGGAAAVRAISCLPALVGAWRSPAGGVLLSTSGLCRLDEARLQRRDLWRGEPRTVNMIHLGRALLGEPDALWGGPPIRALYVYNSNPAAVAPELGKVHAGLRRSDLFTVVHELFLTDTARFADLVLPATTQMEHLDLIRSYGHYWLQLSRPLIDPVGQSRCNTDVFRELAARLGLDDPAFSESDETLARQALGSGDATLEGLRYEALAEKGALRLNLPRPFAPFAEGGFPTPSGRCQFYEESAVAEGRDPLPDWVPPHESPASAPELAARYPLQLVSPSAHHFLNSSFANLDPMRAREARPALWVHPEDAGPRGIHDGDRVRVFNGRGEVRLSARLTGDVPPGTVVSPSLWWSDDFEDGRSINHLSSGATTDRAGGATFHDCLVQLSVDGGVV